MITSIAEILSALPVNSRVKEYGLWKAWDRLVGPQVSKHCQPERLKDGILFLRVSSSVWMQQLQFMKSMILEMVNGCMGENAVRELRFQIGKIGPVRKGNLKPWRDVSLPQEVLMRIDRELSLVGDPELRDIIRKLRVKEAQVKVWEDQRRKGDSSTSSPE